MQVQQAFRMQPGSFPGLRRLVVCSPLVTERRGGLQRQAVSADQIERLLQHVSLAAPSLTAVLLQVHETGQEAFSALDAFRAPFEPPFEVLGREDPTTPTPAATPLRVLGAASVMLVERLLALGFHGCTPVSAACALLDAAVYLNHAPHAERLIRAGATAWPRPPRPPLLLRAAAAASLRVRATVLHVLASEPHPPYTLAPADLLTLLSQRSVRRRRDDAVAALFAPLLTADVWRAGLAAPAVAIHHAAPLRPWLAHACRALGLPHAPDPRAALDPLLAMLAKAAHADHAHRTFASLLRSVLALLPPGALTPALRRHCVEHLLGCQCSAAPLYAVLLPADAPPIPLAWAALALLPAHAPRLEPAVRLLAARCDLPPAGLLAYTAAPVPAAEGVAARCGRGAVLRVASERGVTLLHRACSTPVDRRLAYHLLLLGADANAQDAAGRTPLHCLADASASASGSSAALPTLARALISAGAQVHSEDAAGATPLSLARARGSPLVALFRSYTM